MEERVIRTIGLALNADLTDYSIDDCVPDRVESWDSFAFLNMVVLLEEEFDVSFDFEDIAEMAAGGSRLLEVIKKVIA